MPRPVLTMIVKDEAKIIARCLKPLIPHISSWVICDTGSTDDTEAVVKEVLGDVPGNYYHVRWVNFGHNRTQAMELARPHAPYTLMVDADYVLNIPDNFDWDSLTADAYAFRHEGQYDLAQTWLFRNDIEWEWVGAVHEYVRAVDKQDPDVKRLPEISITNYDDGANERDDLSTLLKEFKASNYKDARTAFYLAQTYVGLERWEDALTMYYVRAGMESDNPEETWYATMMIARMMDRIGKEPSAVKSAYIKAYFLRPQRYEPLCWLAQYCRLQNEFELAFTFSSIVGTDMRYPSEDGLLIDRPVYDYLMLFEFGISAAMTKRLTLAEAAYVMLQNTEAPEDYIQALKGVLAWAKETSSG